MKTTPVLILLVLLCLVSNLVLALVCISRVNRSAHDYVVTEASFVRSVHDATTNFLATVVPQVVESSESSCDNLSVTVRFVDGLCIYYRPSLRVWVLRYKGCDFFQGDYFDDGLLFRIVEGRAYCKTNQGVFVLRPSGRADEPLPRTGLGARPPDEEQEERAL